MNKGFGDGWLSLSRGVVSSRNLNIPNEFSNEGMVG